MPYVQSNWRQVVKVRSAAVAYSLQAGWHDSGTGGFAATPRRYLEAAFLSEAWQGHRHGYRRWESPLARASPYSSRRGLMSEGVD